MASRYTRIFFACICANEMAFIFNLITSWWTSATVKTIFTYNSEMTSNTLLFQNFSILWVWDQGINNNVCWISGTLLEAQMGAVAYEVTSTPTRIVNLVDCSMACERPSSWVGHYWNSGSVTYLLQQILTTLQLLCKGYVGYKLGFTMRTYIF